MKSAVLKLSLLVTSLASFACSSAEPMLESDDSDVRSSDLRAYAGEYVNVSSELVRGVVTYYRLTIDPDGACSMKMLRQDVVESSPTGTLLEYLSEERLETRLCTIAATGPSTADLSFSDEGEQIHRMRFDSSELEIDGETLALDKSFPRTGSVEGDYQELKGLYAASAPEGGVPVFVWIGDGGCEILDVSPMFDPELDLTKQLSPVACSVDGQNLRYGDFIRWSIAKSGNGITLSATGSGGSGAGFYRYEPAGSAND